MRLGWDEYQHAGLNMTYLSKEREGGGPILTFEEDINNSHAGARKKKKKKKNLGRPLSSTSRQAQTIVFFLPFEAITNVNVLFPNVTDMYDISAFIHRSNPICFSSLRICNSISPRRNLIKVGRLPRAFCTDSRSVEIIYIHVCITLEFGCFVVGGIPRQIMYQV